MAKPKTAQPKRGGFTPAQIAAGNAAREKASNGTPAAVLAAFSPQAVIAGDYQLPPLTMSTLIELQKLRNPMIATSAEQAAAVSLLDIARALFVLVTPVAEARRMIAQPGREEFDEAVNAMTDGIPPRLVPELAGIVERHIASAFDTVVPHGKGGGGDADSPFAPRPTPETASGGSGR